jgi:transcriptional regulator with XRE-family HTH domain
MVALHTDLKSSIASACAELVRRLLLKRNWKPARLAEELGVHPDLVRRWLRGERMLQLDDLLTIADMADASLDEVFGCRGSGQMAGELAINDLADKVASRVAGQLGLALLGAASPTSAGEPGLRAAGQGPMASELKKELSASAQRILDMLADPEASQELDAKPSRQRRPA